uniref:glutenin, high molecular weight subunit DX5-like n=1 Tax=Styela clava TaxID=7725 RepID=UPI001939F23F|nr:glutenin, high molecular weight subunit DX5-like [Styela clava]
MMKKIIVFALVLALFGICNANSPFEIVAKAGKRRARNKGGKKIDVCDAKQQDMCTKNSKSLWAESKKGECAKRECIFNPTTGVTQHPQSMYYRFNPNLIKTSSRKILYSFKEIKGEVCSIKNQPCSCRNEEKCHCESDSAKFCKQQYRIERNYFIVYNSEGLRVSTVYQQPQEQQQTNQYGSQYTGGQQYPSNFEQFQHYQPQARTGEVGHVDDDSDENKPKAQTKVRSGEIGNAGNGYGMGGAAQYYSAGQSHQYNPMMQFQGQQGYYPSNQQQAPSYPTGSQNSQSDMMRFQMLAQNLQAQKFQGGFPQMNGYPSSAYPQPQQNPQGFYPPQQNYYPSTQGVVGTNMAGQPYGAGGHPFSPPMNSQQYYPAPPAPSAPMEENQEEDPGQERSLDDGNTETYDSSSTENQHDQPTQQYQNTYYYPQQQQQQQGYQYPQTYMPQSHMPQMPQNHMPQAPMGHAQGGMASSAMLRYLMFQGGASSNGNSFLTLLPYLMQNPHFSQMIRFETLYIMVPDGCKCQKGAPNVQQTSTPQRPNFNFWGQPQYQQQYSPYSNYPSYQQGSQGYSQQPSYPQYQDPSANLYSQGMQRSFGGMGGMGSMFYNPYAQPNQPTRQRSPRTPRKRQSRKRDNKKDNKDDKKKKDDKDDKKSSS